jgi:hypothetical protein
MKTPAYPHGPRGLASMPPARRRIIAKMGGLMAQASRRAHRWDSAEAARAGKLGGQAPHTPKPPRT